jgi:transcriptional regulator with PAS, ATPase and Fis domain
MQRLRLTIDRLGPTNVCALLLGESGVGKERVASALHKAGHGGPFVALNCAAIPKDLLESELFGVEKGAFTGATKSRPGLVEQANGGTLFLDEIGEMEIGVQPKLLRFLETRKARRVGGESEFQVNVRVISATNRNLETEIAERRFRPDLYYRLAELILQIPPLRARPEDIPELALTFLRGANERFGKNIETLEPALISRFQAYDWPGNVRELKSAIDRLVLLFDGPALRAPWWEPNERWAARPVAATPAPPTAVPGRGVPPVDTVAPSGTPPAALPNTKQKLALAKKLLAESDNDYSWVAGQLGVNSSTLWRWRKGGKLD